MGSLHYAHALASERHNVVAMLSLETLGYYSELSGSQEYPGAVGVFFPNTGNLLAFVGNDDSANLVHEGELPIDIEFMPDGEPGVLSVRAGGSPDFVLKCLKAGGTTRIINARLATRHERQQYES